METKLHFIVTTVEGTPITQDIEVPEEVVEKAINQMFAQYAQIGMVKKDGNTFRLLPSHQIAAVAVDMPSVVIASPSDTARMASAAGSLKKIIT